MSRGIVLVILLGLVLAGTAAKADPKAEQILKQYLAASHAAKTFQADLELFGPPGAGPDARPSGHIVVVRPNKVRQDLWMSPVRGASGKARLSAPHDIIIANGKYIVTVSADGSYTRDHESEDAIDESSAFDLEGLCSKDPLSDIRKVAGENLRYVGRRNWMGGSYDVVDGASPTGQSIDLYFGRDHLLHRIAMVQGGQQIAINCRNIVLNARVPSDAFSLNLPRFAKTLTSSEGASPAEKPLLAAGTTAPDFTVSDRDGKPIKLSNYSGRVVVIDFWATWCEPCQMEMPITNKVAAEYAGRNVTVLGVNVWDTKQAFDAWLPQHKEYSAITFAIDPAEQHHDVASSLYAVSGIPTQYVIDPAGKVAWSNVGYDPSPANLEHAIDAALKTPALGAAR